MTDKDNDSENKPFTAKDMFHIAKETRDLEIKMFWQRTNYFLLLNTAVGSGFLYSLSQELSFISGTFCVIGFFVCLAWISISLGSKYWQSHWEQIVIDLQEEVGFAKEQKKDYFSKETKKRVIKNIAERNTIPELYKYKCICTKIKSLYEKIFSCKFFKCMNNCYKRCVLGKPSVSKWMCGTAFAFLIFWFVALCFVFLSTDSSMAEVCHTHTLSTAEAQCD